LILDLAGRRGLRPFVLAGPGEEQEAADLALHLGEGTPVFAGLGLRELAALLSQARLFAGADSSGAQIAAAEGVPCLMLSCHPVGAPAWHANAPERFGPWGVESLVLRPAEHAWPCRRGCEAFTAHCILELDPQEVRAAALAWKPGPRGPRP
jgi:ADP-heptose:LPS heptosyltransferase